MKLSVYKKAFLYQVLTIAYMILPFALAVFFTENGIRFNNEWLISLGVLWFLGFVAFNILRLFLFKCPECDLNIFYNYTPHLLFNVFHNLPYKKCTKCGYDHTKA